MEPKLDVFPSGFLERLCRIVPKNKFNQVTESFTVRRPVTFRANTLKISSTDLSNKLLNLGFKIESVPWYSDAFILKNSTQRILTETDIYKQGLIYLQSLSSMIPSLILDPKPNEKVLDITAAPGSKTSQIAAMMENTGEILANDKSRVRNYKLKANLELLGVTNTNISQIIGQLIWEKLPEYFDRTLVDVPCSMEGRFFVDSPKTFSEWSLNKIKFLEEQQKYILRSAISATKPNGLIVYSTCTLSPEENEKVIDWILKKEGGAIVIEKINLKGMEFDEALTGWNNKIFNSQVSNTVRILPSEYFEGFFIAKIRKLKSTVYKYE